MSSIESRLREHNITLPEAAAPAAAYVPYTQSGNHIFVSGQLPFKDGALSSEGHVPSEASLEDAQEAAKYCAVNILAQLKAACDGDLSKVTKIIKIEVLVSSDRDFTQAHLVANGASEFLVAILGGTIGSHARAAYGVAVLPLNASVEITAMAEIA